MTKPTFPLQSCLHVPDLDTLVPAPELSLPIQYCRHISKWIIVCIRERQLRSGNESVEIRYVNGSFVAGTSRRLRQLAFLVIYTKSIYVCIQRSQKSLSCEIDNNIDVHHPLKGETNAIFCDFQFCDNVDTSYV